MDALTSHTMLSLSCITNCDQLQKQMEGSQRSKEKYSIKTSTEKRWPPRFLFPLRRTFSLPKQHWLLANGLRTNTAAPQQMYIFTSTCTNIRTHEHPCSDMQTNLTTQYLPCLQTQRSTYCAHQYFSTFGLQKNR